MKRVLYGLLICVASVLQGCAERDRPSRSVVGDQARTAPTPASPADQPKLETAAEPAGTAMMPVAAAVEDETTRIPETGGQPDAFLLAEGETASAGSAQTAKSVTFDHIKFDMKKGDRFKQRMLTDKIRALFDTNIKIRGYILPTFKQNGLTSFVLVRDNMECCFGPGAALFDCIIVDMADGKTTSYTPRPVTVEGKFTFQKYEDPLQPGELRAIYHLDAVQVK